MHQRFPHPSIFLLLAVPYGVANGYVTIPLAYQLARAGFPVAMVASLIGVSLIPSVWGFGWAHLVDAALSRKTWYILGAAISGLGILVLGLLAGRVSFSLLMAVAFLTTLASSFVAIATGGLMAGSTDAASKGRAGGWYQAGNLGGGGIGGGLGLWLAQHLHAPWMVGGLLFLLCLFCCLGLLRLPVESAPTVRAASYGRTMLNILKDVWGTVIRTRRGFLALVLCLMPIGSGGAASLWSAVAGDWRASADMVALITGVLGGGLSALGCLGGGWVCDRMDRKRAYVLFGLLMVACALVMAFCPRTPAMYALWASAYALISGLAYAGFSAFALEVVDSGAMTTKYNAFVSISNAPITAMVFIDGWAHTRWGARGMLCTEALLGVVGCVLFLGVARVLGERGRGPELAKGSS
nr:MFS transporter [uncultured Holophaga sp.]